MNDFTASDIIRAYRKDILLFAREQFQFEPDEWQKKALLACADEKHKVLRIALSACVGPGKSAVLAIMAWWFLITQGEAGNHPKGIVLSVTAENLRDNLWAEITKWGQRSLICRELFDQNSQRIYCKSHPDTWFLSARSFPRTASPETLGRTLSGIHSKYAFFIIDESGTIHPNILKSAEQAMSTSDIVLGRIVQAGNPADLHGMLHQAVMRDHSKWVVIRITGDPEDPDRSPRISLEWAKEQIALYGRDDPWVRIHILGLFPESAVNSLLSVDEVEEAMRRHYRIEQYGHAEKRLGVDVAGTGIDLNIFFPRQGLVAFKYSVMRQGTPSDIAARVILAKDRWEVEQVFVDSTGGWGSGAIDALASAGHECHGINFAHKSVNSRFANQRAEMWWNMAEWVRRGGCLPKCDYLTKELTEVLYTTKDGKFIIEPKEQIIKRLSFSPDRADALALTFALPEMRASDSLIESPPTRLKDYDPLANI